MNAVTLDQWWSIQGGGAVMADDGLLDIATEEDIRKAQEELEKEDLLESAGQFLWAYLAVGAIVGLGFLYSYFF